MKKLWQIYKNLIYESRHWIYFIIGLALVWMTTGAAIVLAYPPALPAFVAYLSGVFKQVLGDVNMASGFELATAIFRQNALASVYDLLLGIALGLFPVFSIAFNFFALGFLGGPYLAPHLFPGLHGSIFTFILSIAPHGIFEIPALLLAAAFGLRLGWGWLLPSASGHRAKVLKQDFFGVLKILPMILVLLMIAAAVEAFVTARLVG